MSFPYLNFLGKIITNCFFTTLLGIFVGVLATWLFAKWYYEKSARDLKTEASKLRAYNKLILSALEYTGLAEFTKDGKVDFKGLLRELKATASVETKTSDIELTVNGNEN